MTDDLWLRYVLKDTSDGENEAIRARLEAQDAEAVTEIRRWERVLAGLGADRLLEPSQAVVEAVYRVFRASGNVLPDWVRGLRERAARLVFDSLAAPEAAFAGARSASIARRLRYETDGLELDLLVESEGDRRRLAAQLLLLGTPPRPLDDARWLLLSDGRLAATGSTDERGELVAETERGGEVELRVAHGGALVTFHVPEPLIETPED
ncbi:MAG: hypothetical protein KC591_16735 [Gemmatimonadetes bacterium]|nr:hypothetical protein [Gemmatimonadota bacterium]